VRKEREREYRGEEKRRETERGGEGVYITISVKTLTEY